MNTPVTVPLATLIVVFGMLAAIWASQIVLMFLMNKWANSILSLSRAYAELLRTIRETPPNISLHVDGHEVELEPVETHDKRKMN
jgi:hypothetical protein